MKTTIIFLVAVIVFSSQFLEFSTASTVKIASAGERVHKARKNALAKDKQTIEDAVTQATRDNKAFVEKVANCQAAVKTAKKSKENCVKDALKQFVYKRIGTSNKALAKFIKAYEDALADACNDEKKDLPRVGLWLPKFKDLVADRHNDLRNLVNGNPCEDRDEVVEKLEIAIKDTEANVTSFRQIPDKLKAIMEKTIIETIVGNAEDCIKVLESLKCVENRAENALKEFIYERIGTSNKALAKFIKAYEDALANACDDEIKDLPRVGHFLPKFKDLVADRHNDLENLVNGDPCEDRDEVIRKLEIAIKDTNANVASFKRIPDELKAIMEETIIDTIVGCAEDCIEVLERLKCVENRAENALKEFIYERIETSNKALAEFIKAYEDALADACNDEKKDLPRVGLWLPKFKDLVADRHNDLRNLVNGDPCEDRDEVVEKLEIAIKDTEANVTSFRQIPDKLKAIMEKTIIETIVGNAEDCIKVLESLKCVENRAENALKEFIYERIGTSNKALAEFIKAYEDALADACNDEKKDLPRVGLWLPKFKDLVADRHNDLRNLVNGDPCEDRDEVVEKLEIAIKDTETNVTSFRQIPDKLKAIMEKTIIETIVGNAEDCIKVLESLKCVENRAENALKEFIYERIGTSNKALAKFIKAYEDALANACDDEIKDLPRVGHFLPKFKDLVADRHNDLENLVNGDPCEDRDEVIRKLEIAIRDTNANVASFKRIPDELKAIMEETIIDTIVGCAEDCIEVLERLKCTENRAANAQQFNKRIGTSNKDLAKYISC